MKKNHREELKKIARLEAEALKNIDIFQEEKLKEIEDLLIPNTSILPFVTTKKKLVDNLRKLVDHTKSEVEKTAKQARDELFENSKKTKIPS